MGTKDTRIDAYITRSADFAKPILNRIRKVVHAACPDVEETMKWSFPHFMHKGMLCGMTAFENFSYSHKKEYLEWITEAKRDETRQQRLKTAIEWLAKGKPRNWKYMKC